MSNIWTRATDEQRAFKVEHGFWPQGTVRPRPGRRYLRRGRTGRAPLPLPTRHEEKLTGAEVVRRLTAIKLERGCMDCGYRAHSAALEFDHARGVKSIMLSQCREKYWSVVEHELAKCDVVCANCHRVRTVTRRQRNV